MNNIRFFNSRTKSCLLLGLSACTSALNGSAAQSRPNIILIMTDQQTQGAMSCVGNEYVKSPAMDALAQDGLLLSRAYCPFPLSGPSRASIMTGRMPCEVGVPDNQISANKQDMDNNIGAVMSANGYESLYAGKWHIPKIDVPEGIGFTKICGMDDRTLVDATANVLAQKRDKPLFMVVSFLNPHEICEYAREQNLPYGNILSVLPSDCPPLPANFMPSTYEPEAIRLRQSSVPRAHPTQSYTQDDWRKYLYTYYRLVERVDVQIARLVQQLKSNNLYDNSLIIFTSDHGDGVAAHGWNQKWALFEEVINVPLVVKAPKGRGLSGVKNSSALSNIGLDIYSTICDYAGVKLTEKYKGISLRALVEGKSDSMHSQVFVETLLSGIDVRGWSVVEGQYKYVLYNIFRNKEQLFDLDSDRGEMVNLAVDKKYEKELLRLRKSLYDWSLRVNDTRLRRALENELN